MPATVGANQRVDHATAARTRGQRRAQRRRALLVRQGDVGAVAVEGRERSVEVLGIDRGVVHVHAGLFRERGMDPRRQRMGDGVAEQGVAPAHQRASRIQRATSSAK